MFCIFIFCVFQCCSVVIFLFFFFFKQKTAYEMRISDWSSDVCSSDLTDDDGIICLPSVRGEPPAHERLLNLLIAAWETVEPGSWKPAVLGKQIGRASCRERVCQYV